MDYELAQLLTRCGFGSMQVEGEGPMDWDESTNRRDRVGRFTETSGSAPEISLADDHRETWPAIGHEQQQWQSTRAVFGVRAATDDGRPQAYTSAIPPFIDNLPV